MGQPGWMVWCPGDLGSVAPSPVSQKPFPTSAPTFEDFKRLEGGGMGQRGKERQVIMEESGVLGEPETPSGDLLGYRLS